MSFLRDFFLGSPSKYENVSTLLPEQQDLLSQLFAALSGQGGGGAFGDVSNYYRDLLSDNPQALQAMIAPEMRRFQQETIPGLAEQFAGLGSGALSSSGFRNAGVQAGTDLSERIAALRANLKQQGAAGLAGLGQLGLGNYSQSVMTQQGSPGFLSQVAGAIPSAIAGYFTGGPAGAAAGAAKGFGQSSPYGNGMKRSGQVYGGM